MPSAEPSKHGELKRQLERVKGNRRGDILESSITSTEPPPTSHTILIYAPHGQVSVNGIEMVSANGPPTIEHKPPIGILRGLGHKVAESAIAKLVVGCWAALLAALH